MNRLYNGEMQAKNPAGLPPRNPERIVPREKVVEQEWWLRSNDRTRHQPDPQFTYFPQNSLCKNNFQAGALETDHSRRVFKELARQGHSFSEANLHALKQDREIRKQMQKRYWEVMGAPSQPPPPATKSFLRERSQPAEGSYSTLADGPPPQANAAPQPPGIPSAVSASMPGVAAGSRVSATKPLSMVSASQAAASRVSACKPVIDGTGNSIVASEVGAPGDGVKMSELSVSDFYAWRPRMLR